MEKIIFIKIGGEERPASIGMNALQEFNELTRTTFTDMLNIFTKPKAGDIIALAYVMFKDGARRKQLKWEVSMSDVGDWLDESPEVFPRLVNHFMDMYNIPGGDKDDADAAKKK